MTQPIVSLIKNDSSPGSLEKALKDADAFVTLKKNMRVLIKPNLMRWDQEYPIAPYGVFTTSRMIEDMVILLKDHGVNDITIAEGSAASAGKKSNTPKGVRLIFNALGYNHLQKRYGVKLIDFFEEPFIPVDTEGFTLNFARSAIETDFFINMPVLKTHSQTIISLGLKNLKGCLDMKSRRLCHHEELPLDFFCSLFVDVLKPSLTVIDGTFGLEKGPYYLGTAYRMDLIIASKDPVSADILGTMLMEYEPDSIPHLSIYSKRRKRSLSPDSFTLVGINPEAVKKPLSNDFSWRDDNSGPLNWDKVGVSGIHVPKYDQTICTGCSANYNPLVILIASAYKGESFGNIEVLTGKKMTPSPDFLSLDQQEIRPDLHQLLFQLV